MEPGYSRRGAFCGSCVPQDDVPFIDNNGPIFAIRPILVQKTFHANYIELPLMIKMELPIYRGLFRLSGKIGIGPSYMVKGYTVRVSSLDVGPETESVDFNSENNRLNRWDIGAYSGLGIEYAIGPGVIQLEGKYYYGLLNSNNVFGLVPTTLNHSLRFGIGYTISI